MKARKIERLLKLLPSDQPRLLLEIGTGAGGIAHYFSTHAELSFDVMAIDVIDQRQVREGYCFRLVPDTKIPFHDKEFDVVISNHVIEHVGDSSAQLHHLSEMRRVLKDKGLGYLAAPNRWMLIEPHYRLLFLSWLPRILQNSYLQMFGKGQVYDCNPPTLNSLEKMLTDVGFKFENLGVKALQEMVDLEKDIDWMIRSFNVLPDMFLRMLAPLNPTLIYSVWR